VPEALAGAIARAPLQSNVPLPSTDHRNEVLHIEGLHIEGQNYRAKEAKEHCSKKALKPNETRPDLRPSR
jgi:hypothetical protein